jgi:type II secretory pathway predicted ATPase ExeA
MYESFFGLSGPPFRLIPDPAFLFPGKGHREAFAALRVGLTTGAPVTVLTGEVGAGKTTLLQALLASVDPASTATAHVSAAHLDAETLCERLSETSGLPLQPDSLARGDALLAALVSGPRATLLVIDEAQHLAPSALDLLETLANANALAPARLQTCLVGQPELRILLNAAQRSGFRKLIGVDRHLGPLEQAEVRLYVEHRLHRAGWTGRPEFEDAAFAEIFIFTAGNPRRVNLLCNSLMLCACLKKQQRIDAPAVTWAAAAMREDSFQGAPDLLDLGSHFEHRPTLTEAFEPDTPKLEAATRREHTPWSCPSCGALNASTAVGCWTCKAARPSLGAAAKSRGKAIRPPEDTAAAAAEAANGDAATSAHAADDPASLMTTEGTSHDVEPPQSDPIHAPSRGVVPRQVSVARRRRQTILASAASAAVALALLAYVVYRQGFEASLSQDALRDIVANRAKTPAPPAPGADSLRRAAGSVSPASADSSVHPPSPQPAGGALAVDAAAAKAPQGGDNRRDPVADEVPGAAGAAPEQALPVTPAPAGTPTPPCSGPAFALGLCDAESSSTRRQ